MTRGFVDIHSHFVYGLDDGARTITEMETMLDAAHADGVVSLFATPHVTPGVKHFDAERYELHLNQARRYCREKGYNMQLFSGAEILYTPMLHQYCLEHSLPTLGDSEFVLLEFTPDVRLQDIESALTLMKRNGYIPILAHIERYNCLYHGRTAEKLKERYNVRYQVNASTVLSDQGFLRTRKIRSWFQSALVDFIASDAHNVQSRRTRLRKAFSTLKKEYGSQAEQMLGLR